MNNIFVIINTVLIIGIVAIALSWLWQKLQAKSVSGRLSQEEFEAGKRKAQIIDVREKKSFKKKHILGARNIPLTMFKYQFSEIRPDLPVYLYSDSQAATLRAAKILKKNGYQKVYWLEDPFEKWQGQTKASKY
ncbi:rhodanese-like domain-containing protein [Lactobacillus sp. PV034]|uniref:rhodanese-like domain-containing protein n=1 Tax=Lactobacillus sp. PV034 TaxID=2594495 RepID=UPI002240E19F|nr:rhodanese-like domain-containing protein [Lactobacillus sp. PV034]QNQ80187.1 rhodanese-like domain-containing protein [Lactobacillus sp. PV034]